MNKINSIAFKSLKGSGLFADTVYEVGNDMSL